MEHLFLSAGAKLRSQAEFDRSSAWIESESDAGLARAANAAILLRMELLPQWARLHSVPGILIDAACKQVPEQTMETACKA